MENVPEEGKKIQVGKPVILASLNRCQQKNITWNTVNVDKGKKENDELPCNIPGENQMQE